MIDLNTDFEIIEIGKFAGENKTTNLKTLAEFLK